MSTMKDTKMSDEGKPEKESVFVMTENKQIPPSAEDINHEDTLDQVVDEVGDINDNSIEDQK